MLGVLATVLWAGTATAPPGGAACPSEAAVVAELERLGASEALAALGSPEVTVEGTIMRVVLRGRDGSVMGTREVVAPEACGERASVAAVFIAAWVGAWSTKPLSNSPPNRNGVSSADIPAERPTRREDSRIRARAPTPPPAAEAAPPPASATPPASAAPPASVSISRSKRAPTVEAAGLALATHDGDAGTFGAGVLAAYRLGNALAIAALLESTGERETPLGPGFASYRTSRLGVGASMFRSSGHLFADAGIFPELTMLHVDGRQLVGARSITTWGGAVDLRGRLGLVVGRFVPFVFVGGSGALLAQRVYLDNRPGTTTLSRWNVSAGAGLAIVLGKND